MKTSLRKNLLKILSILIVLTAVHAQSALAESKYDGIWQADQRDGISVSYFSITLTNGQILVVDLDEVALYKNPLRGAYIGSFPATNDSPLFSWVNTKTEHLPETRYYSSWHIYFHSENMANITRPTPANASPLPPLRMRKIF